MKRYDDTMSQFTQEHTQYQVYTLANFRQLPAIRRLSRQQQFELEVVGSVFPFKTNSYVVNELIDWRNFQNDPIYTLTFPQRGMLKPRHYEKMASVLKRTDDRREIRETANSIRMELNPHPAGQLEHNVPSLDGQKLTGIQHKYEQTLLFFPSQGQTCHAYCAFCFRWPQFVGMNDLKFAMREADLLVAYLREHSEVTDVLFTGGDPMVMKANILRRYIDPLLDANLKSHRTIRIGTKALSFWPYRFLIGDEAQETLDLFRRIVRSGKHLAIMAHFSHPRELQTRAVQMAIRRIRSTGAEIRTQSPVLRHINDNANAWAKMWQKQVELGCVPYYMFVVRDTGAQHYFGIPLVRAYDLFQEAYQKVSGLARTVRGPSMSANPGKIQVLGVQVVGGKKVIMLNMLQARNPKLALQPFFAEYDEDAIWIDDLKPAFADKFIFE